MNSHSLHQQALQGIPPTDIQYLNQKGYIRFQHDTPQLTRKILDRGMVEPQAGQLIQKIITNLQQTIRIPGTIIRPAQPQDCQSTLLLNIRSLNHAAQNPRYTIEYPFMMYPYRYGFTEKDTIFSKESSWVVAVADVEETRQWMAEKFAPRNNNPQAMSEDRISTLKKDDALAMIILIPANNYNQIQTNTIQVIQTALRRNLLRNILKWPLITLFTWYYTRYQTRLKPLAAALPPQALHVQMLAAVATGCGYGRSLLEWGHIVASMGGYTASSLFVAKANQRAISFYQKHGYVLGDISVDIVIPVFESGYKETLMIREQSPQIGD